MNIYRSLSISLILFLSILSATAQGRGTRYPIVLAHGFLASDGLFSWNKLARWLRWHGYDVYVTEVSAANSIAHRAQQLAQQIDEILGDRASDKVNIIAHSMGGLDGRYLISNLGYGDRVSSLTTLATPHRCTAAADQIFEEIKNGCTGACHFFEKFVALYNGKTTFEGSNFPLAVQNLTTEFMVGFNHENPDDPGVYYQSWAALASPDNDPAKLRRLLKSTFEMIWPVQGRNDGLVPLSSAIWGEFRGILPADHLGVLKLLNPFHNPKHHARRFIRKVADELKVLGH